jgi:hypothetical protein
LAKFANSLAQYLTSLGAIEVGLSWTITTRCKAQPNERGAHVFRNA